MSVTIKDIAAASGVSIGTVDRVLHNRPYVNGEIRAKVLREIERLGYVPNRHASLLSTGAQKTIGFLCLESPAFFWDELANGARAAQRELRSAGLSLISRQIGSSVSADEYIVVLRELLEKGIDLLITVGIRQEQIIEALSKCPVPVATINIDLPDLENRLFYLGPDEEKCGRIAAGLVGRFIGAKGRALSVCPAYNKRPSYISSKRIAAFREVLASSFPGVGYIATLERESVGVFDYRAIRAMTEAYAPDAIYLPSGSAVSVAENPGDFAGTRNRPVLIGHELNAFSRDLLKRDLLDAVVSQRPYNQGYEAVRRAYFYLYDGVAPENRVLHTDLSIVTREML